MAQARDLMDRITAAMVAKDADALGRCYAPDAVAITPDQGEVKGREEIVKWMSEFTTAFPDMTFDIIAAHEDGSCAVDEGYVIGTHTGPLESPGGTLPPTGRRIRLRECDVLECEGDLVREHRFYYDQADFMEQLGATG